MVSDTENMIKTLWTKFVQNLSTQPSSPPSSRYPVIRVPQLLKLAYLGIVICKLKPWYQQLRQTKSKVPATWQDARSCDRSVLQGKVRTTSTRKCFYLDENIRQAIYQIAETPFLRSTERTTVHLLSQTMHVKT